MFKCLSVLPEKKMIGTCIYTSLAKNETYALWHQFMPLVKEIPHKIGIELYSIEIYPPIKSFAEFTPHTAFKKWACVEVSTFDVLPNHCETLIVPSGLYAVFVHYGLLSKAGETIQYIFTEWLPSSDYELDLRPHLSIMGSAYAPESEHSQEELWIPIQKKLLPYGEANYIPKNYARN